MTLSKPLAKQVRERAHYRCEYCQTSEWVIGQQHQVDHINPRALDGATTLNNLCLACVTCNSYKQDRTDAVDPVSGERVALFNPRAQHWHDHFAWSEDGIRVIGLTACGRAMVALLKLNRPLALAARAIWVSAKRHPPTESEV